MTVGCAAEVEPEPEGSISSTVIAPSADVDDWLASQGARGDELDTVLGEGAADPAGFLSAIGKVFSKVLVKIGFGGFSKTLIGKLRLRLEDGVFVDLDFEPQERGSKPDVENAVRIVQIQAALRDGAPLDPVTERQGERLAARFGGRAASYRVYRGGEFKGTGGATVTASVFLRAGGPRKVVAVRTISRPSSRAEATVVDIPKGVF